MTAKILCIDDDLTIQSLVTASLKEFDVLVASNLGEAQDILRSQALDAVLVDIELPDGDGLRFLTGLAREETMKSVPILVLTGHGDISNKVMAFSFGAEDFITKPFDPIELNARVSSKIKRRQAEQQDKKSRKVGNLLIDFDRQKAFSLEMGSEKDLGLTSIELKIISFLTRRMEQVYSREQIMNAVWSEINISDRTVDSHIAHLRQKIRTTNVFIETSKNFGYSATQIKTGPL